jgi:hypothetical protein
MPIQPVPQEKADAAIQPIYASLKKNLGKVPNFHAMLAHRPAVLRSFLPFYEAVVGPGSLEPRFKDLAYLKTSTVNGCEY